MFCVCSNDRTKTVRGHGAGIVGVEESWVGWNEVNEATPVDRHEMVVVVSQVSPVILRVGWLVASRDWSGHREGVIKAKMRTRWVHENELDTGGQQT